MRSSIGKERNKCKYSLSVDTFQVDWDGYTIGYYGRIFEARNKTKGGSFEVSQASYEKKKERTCLFTCDK